MLFAAPVQYSRAQAVILDTAIKQSAAAFSANLEAKTVIAVWSIESDYPDISNYIIEELNAEIVRLGNLTPVERRKLEILYQELNYQVSGMVSDATMVTIGQQLGAGVVIAGSFTVLENQFRLRLKALKVETAEILDMQTKTIKRDRILTALLEGKRDPASGGEAWKYKWLYLGLRGGIAPRFYTIQGLNTNGQGTYISAEGAFQGRVHFSGLFSAQTELDFSGDGISLDDPPITMNSVTLTIPLFVRFDYYFRNFRFGLLAGPGFNIPLGPLAVSYPELSKSYQHTEPVSLLFGGNFGVKLGPGIIFLDLRGGFDLGLYPGG